MCKGLCGLTTVIQLSWLTVTKTKSKCKDEKKTENQMQSLSVKAERQLCGKYIYKTFTHKTISK